MFIFNFFVVQPLLILGLYYTCFDHVQGVENVMTVYVTFSCILEIFLFIADAGYNRCSPKWRIYYSLVFHTIFSFVFIFYGYFWIGVVSLVSTFISAVNHENTYQKIKGVSLFS